MTSDAILDRKWYRKLTYIAERANSRQTFWFLFQVSIVITLGVTAIAILTILGHFRS